MVWIYMMFPQSLYKMAKEAQGAKEAEEAEGIEQILA